MPFRTQGRHPHAGEDPRRPVRNFRWLRNPGGLSDLDPSLRWDDGLFVLVLLASICAGYSVAKAADACPAILTSADKLILVTSDNPAKPTGIMRLFTRDAATKAWAAEAGKPQAVVVGRKGLGWGWNFASDTGGERVKHEGDGLTPLGFFPLGPEFGFGASARPGYLQLQPDKHVCVDDLGSPNYGTIVSRKTAGAKTSGEPMWKIKQYKHGMFVSYPPNVAVKSGSCIFLHIWKSPTSGTAGCIAMPEAPLLKMLEWTKTGKPVLGVLSPAGLKRFAACLPGIN